MRLRRDQRSCLMKKPLVFLFVAWLCIGALPSSSRAALTRSIKIVWQIDTQKIKGEGIPFLFPLPLNDYGQTATCRAIGATKVETVYSGLNHIIRIYPAARMVFLQLDCEFQYVPPEAKLMLYKGEESVAPTPETSLFLQPVCGLDQTTAKTIATARTLKGTNMLASVQNVLEFVHREIRYDYKYWRTTDEILDHKVTQCEGQSALAVALLRQLGIPARMVFLVFPNKPHGNVVDGHTIVQFYLPGSGWLIGDAGQGDKVDASVTMLYGLEPIPYYYCRMGMGALVQPGESLQVNYPDMWQYLTASKNKYAWQISDCMTDFFKVMYDCTVIENRTVSSEGRPVPKAEVDTIKPSADNSPKPSDAERLKELKNLLDQGLISQHVYDQKKQEILNSL